METEYRFEQLDGGHFTVTPEAWGAKLTYWLDDDTSDQDAGAAIDWVDLPGVISALSEIWEARKQSQTRK